MAKFNSGGTATPRRVRATSPMASVATPGAPDTVTHEGGAGYTRTPRTELFLACATSFVAENTTYESGEDRVVRVRELVHSVAAEEGGLAWLLDFVTWLRGEGNIRTAAIIVAAEAVDAASKSDHDENAARRALSDEDRPGQPGRSLPRRIVDAACRRADEPGELLAYWQSVYGATSGSTRSVGKLPNALRRGLADAVRRLYTEFSTLKYDTPKADIRFGDVVALVRPGSSPLYRHLVERRHARWEGVTLDKAALPMIAARRVLNAVPVDARRAMLDDPERFVEHMRLAGVTWEWLSGWLADGKGMDAAAWETVLPQMGYMARLRNLRNFDEQGMSDDVADAVARYLADPDQVAKSRQLPFRFLSAYRATQSDRWKHSIGKALTHSLRNIPELSGSTLVMVDTSGSMSQSMSGNSSVEYHEVAALFGIALAHRNRKGADLYGFANREFKHDITLGASVLNEVEKFTRRNGEAGHGTEIESSTLRAFARKPGGYDRIVIISDMQSFGTGYRNYGGSLNQKNSAIPAHVPIYAFDLSAYKAGILPVGRAGCYQLGGLTDSTFRLISLLEQGLATGWPWENVDRG